ncbi:histidine-rich glycoprotein-like isoform X1 [Brassica napus]|uniref:histidine-rich glycoprotein-like isoform X1 n=1 Tax=Brassica napus TaxID=3708 RepID=UPI002079654E|nr:histidine-rich glycoprotein-like isoform X1 [Brassica napus]
MLDKLIGEYGHGYGNGYGHKDHRSSGYGFEEHKKYESHMESEGGYFDRQARYDHRVRLPVNHGRPPMAHMPPCDEEDSDSDVEEFYKSSRSHHTTVLPDHGKIHRQQPPHMNFMPPPPMSQPHHNGKMGNGWQGRHEDAYLGGHGMQHHGEHGMQHHGEHGMQHHGEHGMQHHGEHGMKHHGAHGMKHQDRLMAPQVLPHHVYMNPNSGGGHHKAGWGNKGL